MPTSSTSTSPNTWAVRPARADDAEAVTALLDELEHPAAVSLVRRRIPEMQELEYSHLLVAADRGHVVGMAALLLMPLVHETAPIGRITTMIVTARYRRAGVGQTLVETMETLAREAGCCRIEVTSHSRRAGAHAFYRRLGYDDTHRRFVKRLDVGDPP